MRQTFQTKNQLDLLNLHSMYYKFCELILSPFTWLTEGMGRTYIFEDYEPKNKIRLIK